MIRNLLVFSLLLSSLMAHAQVGGRGVYSFLDLTYSGRTSSLGGDIVSLFDNDVQLVQHNPAAINYIENGAIGLNYVNYIADINFTQINFVPNTINVKGKSLGNLGFTMNYLDYGDFFEYNEFGQQLGEFGASDWVATVNYGVQLDSMFALGVSYLNIISNYYTFQSWGMGLDIGASYFNPNNLFGMGMVLNNIGGQITSYNNLKEPLPFEVMFGLTKKLAHAPFQLSFTFHDLQQLDIWYQDQINPPQTVDPLTGEAIKQKKYVGQKVLRHINFGVEFVPSDNFNLRFGYNYQRQQELMIANKKGMTGFSFGAGIRIKKFMLDYGHAIYHLAGSTNTLTISTNLNHFIKK